jgi:hypothetical protein
MFVVRAGVPALPLEPRLEVPRGRWLPVRPNHVETLVERELDERLPDMNSGSTWLVRMRLVVVDRARRLRGNRIGHLHLVAADLERLDQGIDDAKRAIELLRRDHHIETPRRGEHLRPGPKASQF